MADFNINPLVAQYLSGLGADLMKYGGNTSEGLQFTKMNEVTNQSIKSNSMMKLINSALGPDGSSMKADSKGLTINATNDSKLFKDILGAEDGSGPFKTDKALMPTTPAPVTDPSAIAPPAITNPFTNIKPSDLAGLSPQEISSVLAMKHSQDQLKQESFKNVVDAMYKGEQITRGRETAAVDIPYKKALTAQSEAATKADTPSVDISYGDKTMKVTPKDAIAWEKMKKETTSKETTPNEIKVYEAAQAQGYKGSIVDFKNLDMTGHEKDFRAAKADGYTGKFNEWLQESIKNGAIKLGEKIEEKKALSELEGQLYFNNPKWIEDIHKQTAEFDKSQAWLIPEKDRPLAKSKVIVKAIEDKIAAGSGAIQSVVMDKNGKTMVWTVKWPSGDVKTIKQAVR